MMLFIYSVGTVKDKSATVIMKLQKLTITELTVRKCKLRK